jgi:CHASE3 domain sensor protein
VLTGLMVAFLVAAVVLGAYYNTAREDLAKMNTDNAQVIRNLDKGEAYSANLAAARTASQSLVGYLLAQADQLKKDKADLTSQVAEKNAELEKASADASEQRAGRAAAENDRNEAKATLAQQRLAFETAEADVAKALATERDRNAALSDSYDKALAEARQSWNSRIEEKDRQVADMETQLRKLQHDLLVAQTKVAEAEGRIRNSKHAADRGPEPDGKLISIDVRKNIGYIDLGKEDRIHIGTTFAVFDGHGEIKNDTKPKGQVIVKNVMAKTSEVEIVPAAAGNPVLAGDLIANVAYDRRGTVVFFVVGGFDLNGNGVEDEHGAESVQNMIRQYGGKVVDQITPDVDYVVTGDAPKLPPRPAPGSPQSQMQLWQDKYARLDQYRKAVEDAKTFQIPVLNTNRLLALLGRASNP